MSLAPRSPLLDGGRFRHNNISATELNGLLKNLRHELKVLLGPFSKFYTKICEQQFNNLQVLDGARQSSLLTNNETNSFRHLSRGFIT